MKKQFTDIYSLIGVNEEDSHDHIVQKCEDVLQECKQMYKKGDIDALEMTAVEEATKILSDKGERSKYNSQGHDKYVSENDTELDKIEFIGGSDIYEDFYDLFGVNPDSDPSNIKRETAIKMKNMHPDRDTDVSATTEQFNTVKLARQVLTDDRKRELYDEKGHTNYVREHLEADLRGFAFTGRGSITESVKEQNKVGDNNIEDLVKFTSHSKQTDPTIKATKEDAANPSSEGTSSSEDSIADTVKKRKEVRENKKSGNPQKNDEESGLKGGKIIVPFLNLITSTVFLLILSSLILMGLTYGLFLGLGALGIGIGVIISLGVYLVILKKN